MSCNLIFGTGAELFLITKLKHMTLTASLIAGHLLWEQRYDQYVSKMPNFTNVSPQFLPLCLTTRIHEWNRSNNSSRSRIPLL